MSPADIISSVPTSFAKALGSGDLFFFPSTTSKYVDSGVEFEIKLCPALQKKPRLPTLDLAADPSADQTDPAEPNEKKEVDPFSPPYIPNLHVGDLQDEDGEEYVVLLNKYSLVPQHFLLVTKGSPVFRWKSCFNNQQYNIDKIFLNMADFRSQSSPLMPSDLVQTYLLLSAARKAGKTFFAFYNCGVNSGASQPHKHVQFIPVESDGPPIEVLARAVNVEKLDKPFSLTSLPYANHVFRFPTQLSSYTPEKLEQTLATAFLALLDLCVSTIRYDPEYPPGKPSYNVLISREHMHLVPRRQESYTISQTGDVVSVNALGFSGMFLVKSNEELEAVKTVGIGKILRAVGLESVHDIQVAEPTNEGE